MRVYTVDVQTTAFFTFKCLITDTLLRGSECQMKSGKELCTNIGLHYRTETLRLKLIKRKQKFSPPMALLWITE